MVGAPGLILSLAVLLTLREPLRGRSDEPASNAERPLPLRSVVKFVIANRTTRFIAIAAMAISAGTAGFTIFLSPSYCGNTEVGWRLRRMRAYAEFCPIESSSHRGGLLPQMRHHIANTNCTQNGSESKPTYDNRSIVELLLENLLVSSLNDSNSATATQLVRDFPEVRRLSERGPVQITSHGRTELIMLNPTQFARMSDSATSDTTRLDGKLSTILGAVDTAIVIFDEDLHVQRVNQAMCDLIDFDDASAIGLSAAAFIKNSSHRYVVERLAEVQKSGFGEMLTATSARGENRTLQIRIKPWPGGVALFADDITDRMKAADVTAANEAMQKAMASAKDIGTAHIRQCGTILSNCQGLAQMTGIPHRSLIGVRLQNLVTPQSRAVVSEALLNNSVEPQCYDVDYLKDGVASAPATLALLPYWTAEHHACTAAVLQGRGAPQGA